MESEEQLIYFIKPEEVGNLTKLSDAYNKKNKCEPTIHYWPFLSNDIVARSHNMKVILKKFNEDDPLLTMDLVIDSKKAFELLKSNRRNDERN